MNPKLATVLRYILCMGVTLLVASGLIAVTPPEYDVLRVVTVMIGVFLGIAWGVAWQYKVDCREDDSWTK